MKNTTIGILAVLFIIGIASVSAFGGFWNTQDKDAIRTAIQNKDFATWKSLMEAQLTEDNFNQITSHVGAGNGQGFGQNQAVQDTIEANDYDAWKTAIADTPRGEEMLSKINADNFSQFVAMHEARQSGDFETANSIADALGISPGFMGRGQGFGQGMGKGQGRGMHKFGSD
ncbi:MAG: hypothetical protein ABIJ34_04800 [archaeon]